VVELDRLLLEQLVDVGVAAIGVSAALKSELGQTSVSAGKDTTRYWRWWTADEWCCASR
jgi:hypothetical protein